MENITMPIKHEVNEVMYEPSIGYLHLTLTHSKVQFEGHFNCEYLENGEIRIWFSIVVVTYFILTHCLIVNLESISTVNIVEMVADREK